MNAAYLRTLVDYHYWARDRVLAAVAALDAEQYGRSMPGSFASVRETLNHVYGAEVLWLRRWHGESPSGFPRELPPNLAALRASWKQQETALRAFVNGLQDDDLQRVISYRNLAGVAGESALWEMLAHVVNHATYHRGQVTTLLRQLGADPPATTDLIAFFRWRGADTPDSAPDVSIRTMHPSDADMVAALHAASWRRAYRGILTNAYLDTDLEAERRSVWTEKLSAAQGGNGWLAFVNEEPAGFVFVRPREDAQWGTLVDNLHVSAVHQGHGLGRRLLNTVGEWTAVHAPHDGVHLWVFADNTAARGFYSRVGGREVELTDREASDGRRLQEYRVAWANPTAMVNAMRSRGAHP